MNCVFWNCQGLGVALTIHTIGEILRKHNPNLLFLSETKATSPFVNRLKTKWNLFGISVDKVGQAGGLAIFWQKTTHVELLSYSNNHIDVMIGNEEGQLKWRCTGIYGFPELNRRPHTWQLIRTLNSQHDIPWLVGGDFNEILANSEKSGGSPRLPSSIAAFRSALDEYGLSDLGFTGPNFTWTNRREAPNTVKCRLDRCCGSSEWISMFPNTSVKHLIYAGSDHLPILLSTDTITVTGRNMGRHPFRFEAMWARQVECEEIVKQLWNSSTGRDPSEVILQNTKGCRIALQQWSRNSLNHPRKRIDKLNNIIHDLSLEYQSAEVVARQRELKSELERTYGDLDTYWRQRSRVQWIKEGDRNTSFFHAKASARKKKNLVHRLKDSADEWQEGNENIEKVITEYFEDLFQTTTPDEREMDEVLDNLEARVDGEAAHMLSTPFSADECGSISPTRGLRQGDPLSPYLFILCTEALIAMLTRSTENGQVQGFRVAPTAPLVSSLCFADDTLIFCQATESNAHALRDILTRYGRVSGQKINLEKSTMTFCPSTPSLLRDNIHAILGFQIVDKFDKYLGLPISLGRTRKEIFSFLRDRIWTRIKGWDSKQLSKAGKEILIKAVLQAIPSYVMSCFILPLGLIDEIEAAVRRFWWSNGDGRRMSWLAWKKIWRPKESGGMGFRDLRAFNLALVAKQVWRIITQPDCLMSHIFQAKYFPYCDFWSASLGNLPSATWRCILAARDHARAGLRVRIGNGESTSIWMDPWFRNEERSTIITPRPIHSAFPSVVADIINPNTGNWDLELIKKCFWPVDWPRILSIPIGGPSTSDRVVWGLSRTGSFTVKTCYHHIMERLYHTDRTGRLSVGEPSGAAGRDWKLLWHLPIPPKIKIFAWRACADILPCKAELYRRKIVTEPFCPLCGKLAETMVHVVYGCSGLKECWAADPFRIKNGDEHLTFWSWIELLHNSLAKELFHLAVIVCWKIWERRNRLLHGEEGMKLGDIIPWCQAFLDEFRDTQFGQLTITKTIHPVTWTPPPAGTLKINVDAAFPANADHFNVSMVARNADGGCVWWRVERILGRVSPAEGEAQAVRHAINTAQRLYWTAIIVEGDCLPVFEALKRGDQSLEPFGAIVEDCLFRVRHFNSCSFSFIKRQGNNLAHLLASLNALNILEGNSLPSSTSLALGA